MIARPLAQPLARFDGPSLLGARSARIHERSLPTRSCCCPGFPERRRLSDVRLESCREGEWPAERAARHDRHAACRSRLGLWLCAADYSRARGAGRGRLPLRACLFADARHRSCPHQPDDGPDAVRPKASSATAPLSCPRSSRWPSACVRPAMPPEPSSAAIRWRGALASPGGSTAKTTSSKPPARRFPRRAGRASRSRRPTMGAPTRRRTARCNGSRDTLRALGYVD